MNESLPFTVTISASEWAGLQRRLRYVETALIQMMRGKRQLKEWFSANDLAGLHLRGLPTTRQGLLRRAHADRWPQRISSGAGGERYEFHFSALPRPAFEDLLGRIVVAMPDDVASDPVPAMPLAPAVALAPPETATNATPMWLLPLLRVIRNDHGCDADAAWIAVARKLPAGTDPPTLDEVRSALRQFGLQG